MPKNNPEICSLINDSCINDFFCGSCSVTHKALLEAPKFKDFKNLQVTSFSSNNRTAILFTPDTDPQNNPSRQRLATVRDGHLHQLIISSELSRLKKGF